MSHTEQWPIETAAEICPVFRHLTGAPARPRQDNIAALARQVADHAINARVCCAKYPPCQTEAWRASLAQDIAALARAGTLAAEEALDQAERALSRARGVIESAFRSNAPGYDPKTHNTIAEIDRTRAAIAALRPAAAEARLLVLTPAGRRALADAGKLDG